MELQKVSTLKFLGILTLIGIALSIIGFIANNIFGFINIYVPVHWVVIWLMWGAISLLTYILFINKVVRKTDRTVLLKAAKILFVYSLIYIILNLGINSFDVMKLGLDMERYGPIILSLRSALQDIIGWPIRVFSLVHSFVYTPIAYIFHHDSIYNIAYVAFRLAQAFLPFAMLLFAKNTDKDTLEQE